MKKLTKILTLCLVLALVLCMAPAVFADEPDGTSANPYQIDSGFFDFTIAETTKTDDSTWFKMEVCSTGYMSFALNGVFKPDDVYTTLDNVQEVVVSIYEDPSEFFPIEDIMIPADATAPVISTYTYDEGSVIYFAVNVTSTSYDPIAGFVDIAGAYGGTAELPFTTDFADGVSTVTISKGVTMYYTNRQWNNYQGIVVSTTQSGAISDETNAYTTVYVNGTTYTDEDKDGVIELPIPSSSGGAMTQMAIGIYNNSKYMMMPVTYTITLKETAQVECPHTDKGDVIAKAPECHTDGYKAHKKCEACGALFDATTGAETTMAALTDPAQNSLEYVGKTNTCVADGEVEHWHCDGCGKNYADEAGATELTDLFAGKTGHSMEYVEGYESTDCQTEGRHDYYFCSTCTYPDSYYTDEEGKNPIAYEDIYYYADHVWVIDEVTEEPDCFNPGVGTAHCEVCDLVDEEYAVPADPAAHGDLDHIDGTPACHADGIKEHWYCSTCDCYFTDAEGKHNVAYLSLVIPATTDLDHIEGIPACHADGIKEHWYCEGCDTYFADAEGANPVAYLRLVIPGEGATALDHIEGTPACHADGIKEHWYCEGCDTYFTDAEGANPVAYLRLILPGSGELTHVAATDTVKEHWYCEGCDTYFADAEGKQPVAYLSLTISTNPKTGDAGIVLALTMALACMTGAVVLTKKKF